MVDERIANLPSPIAAQACLGGEGKAMAAEIGHAVEKTGTDGTGTRFAICVWAIGGVLEENIHEEASTVSNSSCRRADRHGCGVSAKHYEERRGARACPGGTTKC